MLLDGSDTVALSVAGLEVNAGVWSGQLF